MKLFLAWALGSCVILFGVGCAGSATAPRPGTGGGGSHDVSDPGPEATDSAAYEAEATSLEADAPRSVAPSRSKEAESVEDMGADAARPGATPAAGRAERSRRRPKRKNGHGSKAEAAEDGYGAGYAGAAGVPVAPRAPAIKAGRHDDNRQYNRFLAFLRENAQLAPYRVDVSERLVLRTVDARGDSLWGCTLQVMTPEGELLAERTTYADGRSHFFPSEVSTPEHKDYVVLAHCGDATRNGQASRHGRREVEIRFGHQRQVPKRVPLDIAVVLDTTGSMGGQIERLKSTLRAINFQLSQLPSAPLIRFALVAYRDRGDDYVTRVTPFTDDVAVFQSVLEGLDADGGGDAPEDLQSGLEKAMHELDWRKEAIRLGFIVADAVPHTDYGQDYNYVEAMQESLRRGVKWTTVGAGGLGRKGEVIFRQIAQLAMGEYVFVTQGGAPADREGSAGEASHHVGSNYRTENLDQAIVRIVRRELSYLTAKPKDFDETIVATAKHGVPRDTVLVPAVKEALRQLVDYSSIMLKPQTPVAVLPVASADDRLAEVAEHLSDQFVLEASRHEALQVLERDLRAVAQEIKLQLSDLFDVEKTVAIGEMVGAEALVVTKVVMRGDTAEIFTKLVRVQTGEILSVANVQLPARLLGTT